MSKPIELAIVNPSLYYSQNPDWKTEPSELDDDEFYAQAKKQETLYKIKDLEEDWAEGSVQIDSSVDLLRVYPRNHFRSR